jgi:hypothetical protein
MYEGLPSLLPHCHPVAATFSLSCPVISIPLASVTPSSHSHNQIRHCLLARAVPSPCRRFPTHKNRGAHVTSQLESRIYLRYEFNYRFYLTISDDFLVFGQV